MTTEPIQLHDVETLKKFSLSFKKDKEVGSVMEYISGLNKLLDGTVQIKPELDSGRISAINYESKLNPEHVDILLSELTGGNLRNAHCLPHIREKQLMIKCANGSPELSVVDRPEEKFLHTLTSIRKDIAEKAANEIAYIGTAASTMVEYISDVIESKKPDTIKSV